MITGKTMDVTAERHYDFTAEQVFDAWLNPDSVRHWLFATPDGVMQRVELNPVVGGSYLVIERRPEGVAEHFGQYVRIQRSSLLEFTFSIDRASPNFDRVLVELTPEEVGCNITLTHQMDARWAEYADRTKSGWASILEGLNRTLLEGD
jgi:uncharacterized protein YndB with AHSA1/START domain